MQESLGFQLVQEQTQKLVMNQEMRQAITILQYSSIELMDYIQRQMEENPLFEYEQNRTHSYTLPSHAYLDRTEFIPTQAESLEQTLLEQLSFANLTPKQIKIGQYLIGLIDADGYLREEITNIAQELRCSVNLVDDVLSIIQSFEPIGVGARNLNECLLIQLKHNGVCSPFLEDIITNHLNELAERKYAFLMDKYKVQKEELQKVLSLIEDINPRPGLSYSRADTKYVVPDVYVDLIDGELLVSLNDYIFPHLKINEGYRQLLHSKGDAQAKSYLQEKLRSALWMIKSIEQRRSTILKVTEAIFEHQKSFFNGGFDAIKPLTLQEIALKVGLHESTISRTVNQKYVQTPKGSYELKRFFVRGIQSASGDLSTYSIKKRICHFIDQEDKTSPFSDQAIAEFLQHEGIQISRRTVMKYREELNILSSSKRRFK